MLDYKSILVKRYVLHLSGREIAKELGYSKTSVNDFIKAFDRCESIRFPLPQGITNAGIHDAVYGKGKDALGRNPSFEYPEFDAVHEEMKRSNMTLLYQWNRYQSKCVASSLKPYSYRQFCDLYSRWCGENGKTAHFDHAPGQSMEVDFAGKTFRLADPVDGSVSAIVVFVAVLPYSQTIYAEGMSSTKEPQWIGANNNALDYFGGVPQIVVCDNCKQAVIANKDWIEPTLNADYAEWADHNGTAIMAAKVRRPKYKPSVEGAVKILESGIFHDLGDAPWMSLKDFNSALLRGLDELNRRPFAKKEHSRSYYHEEEKKWLLPLPSEHYEYAERREATVSSDYHIRFDNAYYSCPPKYLHRRVLVRATATEVRLYDLGGALIRVHARATRKGEWVTCPDDLPAATSHAEWSPEYFIGIASAIGPQTTAVVKAALESTKYPVQAFRRCLGIVGFAKKHGNAALEEACRLAVLARRPNYTFVKNYLASMPKARKSPQNRNEFAFLAPKRDSELGSLIEKTKTLMGDGNDD